MGDIKTLLLQIVKDEEEIYSIVGKVDSVDEDARTCSVSPINDSAKLFGVRLQASPDKSEGVVSIPKVDSIVMVTFINKNAGYVAICDEVDKVLIDTPEVLFNGGDNGGLINISDLVNKINALESSVNGLIISHNTHIHITTATVGPSAVPGVISPTVAQDSGTIAPLTTQQDLEDTLVKH